MADGGRLLILCEGEGDAAFFRHLASARGLPQFRIVYPKPQQDGGWRGFAPRLRALKTEPEFGKLAGILVAADNDDEPATAFGNVCGQLRAAGFPVPERPLEAALTPGHPPLAVMMLPWTGEPGNLESLCLGSMYARWPALRECLDAFCECCGTAEWRYSRQSKMRVRVLLSAACRTDPNTSLVYAWSRSEALIPLDHSCFDQVAGFLTSFPGLVSQSSTVTPPA